MERKIFKSIYYCKRTCKRIDKTVAGRKMYEIGKLTIMKKKILVKRKNARLC